MSQHGLLKHLECLRDEQCGGAVRLTNYTKHKEGTALKGRVVEEGSSVGRQQGQARDETPVLLNFCMNNIHTTNLL